jgi:AraC-like DNA-binding protein/quercetin dioxygenase-like cupin family protein
MATVVETCTFWRMGHTWFAPSSGLRTRLGWVSMAGEVVDDLPRVQTPMRTMDDWILSFVIAGSGVYRHADGSTVPLPAGSVTLVPPGVAHWYGTRGTQSWSELFVVFNGPVFDLLAAREVLDGTGAGPRAPSPVPSAATLRGIVRASVHTTAAAEHQVMAVADWLLGASRSDDEPSASALDEAARQLAGDTTAKLRLSLLAESLGLSYDTFRHRLAAEFGQSPAAYRNAARLTAAAAMLKLTDLTTGEIARRLGYTDEFHLSRRFRSRYGSPPGRYRQG